MSEYHVPTPNKIVKALANGGTLVQWTPGYGWWDADVGDAATWKRIALQRGDEPQPGYRIVPQGTHIPHRLVCVVEDNWPTWRLECPYAAIDEHKPCAKFDDWEADKPTEFTEGCGGQQAVEISDTPTENCHGLSGDLPLDVDVKWQGEAWIIVPHVEVGGTRKAESV